jgi:hypothetical protein
MGVLAKWDRRNQRVLQEHNAADPVPNRRGVVRSQAVVSGLAFLRIAVLVVGVMLAGLATRSPGGLAVTLIAAAVGAPLLWSLSGDITAARGRR